MAKPGQGAREEMGRLASMARQATDLSDAKGALPDEVVEKVRAAAEGRLGMRCGGCHQRITMGFQFTRIDVVRGADGRPEVDVARLSACSREECTFADEARAGALAVEMVEFAWLDKSPAVAAERERRAEAD